MKKKFCRHTDFMPTTSITRRILASPYLTFLCEKIFLGTWCLCRLHDAPRRSFTRLVLSSLTLYIYGTLSHHHLLHYSRRSFSRSLMYRQYLFSEGILLYYTVCIDRDILIVNNSIYSLFDILCVLVMLVCIANLIPCIFSRDEVDTN
jgi:hypothetical protein